MESRLIVILSKGVDIVTTVAPILVSAWKVLKLKLRDSDKVKSRNSSRRSGVED